MDTYQNPFLSSSHTQYQIRSGSSLRDFNGYLHDVVEIHKHPQYNVSEIFDLDVAVMRVRQPFRLDGRSRRKVRLTEGGHDMPVGAVATITGWGLLEVRISYFFKTSAA